MTFNAAGFWLTDKVATGQTVEQDYSVTRDPTSNYPLVLTDALIRKTKWTYDPNGNILTVTRLLGTANAVTTTFTYTPTFNQIATIKDPLNHTTTFQRNALDQVTAIVDPLLHSTSFSYDYQGQLQTVTDALTPANTTRYDYDHGDLAKITDPLSRVTTIYTDAIGRPIRVTDPLGNFSTTVPDPIDGAHLVTDANGATTTINYNPDGLVATIVDAKSNPPTIFTYDAKDHLSTRTDPLAKIDQFTSYDKNDNLLTATDRKGLNFINTYDALNRIATKVYPRLASTATTTYTWDKGNHLNTISDTGGGGTITRVYDGLDRLTSEATATGTVGYTYDAANRRATMTVTGQADAVYTFDDANRLTQITQGAATVQIGYDNANRRTSLTLPSGIVATYGYTNASELSGITYKQGATTVGTLTYNYDLAGRLASRGGTLFQSVLPTAVQSAAYDFNNRLTNWTITGSGVSPTYDDNGNLINDGTRTYTWDSFNRLTGISAVTASFNYDGIGRRIRSIIGSTTTRYLYDGADIVNELPATGTTPSATILTGLGIDERFTRTVGAATSTYLSDNLGSTVALADGTGTVQTNYGYDPYGNASTTGTANSSVYQYTGRENDGATGLHYYRARYYNPAWGRFISEDRIGLAGGTNLYRYANNNPLQLRDPAGLWQVTVAGGAGVGGLVTFGFNHGQLNVGGYVGAGAGVSASFDPEDSPPAPGSEPPGFEWGAKGLASGRVAGLVEGDVGLDIGSGGISVEGSLGIEGHPLGVSGHASITGSKNPTLSYGVGPSIGVTGAGAVVFGGVGGTLTF